MIFFTGGTLGHIVPCVTLIKEIKKRYKNIYVMVVATNKDKEYEILKEKVLKVMNDEAGEPLNEDDLMAPIAFPEDEEDK